MCVWVGGGGGGRPTAAHACYLPAVMLMPTTPVSICNHNVYEDSAHDGLGTAFPTSDHMDIDNVELDTRWYSLDSGHVITHCRHKHQADRSNEGAIKQNNMTLFGADVVEKFLKVNQLSIMIRANQICPDGIDRFASGQCITITSCTNYCGTHQNDACFLVV